MQMNLSTNQIDSQTQKTNLWLPKGKGGATTQFRIKTYALQHKKKTDNQPGPTV